MVTIYSQPGCGPCEMAKKYFTKFGKEYQVKDRAEYAEEMFKIANTYSTPVITDGKNVVVGFRPMELSELL